MREASVQRSVRLPERVDQMLDDLIQEGLFRNRTEAIVHGVLQLFEDLTMDESQVNLRVKVTKGEFNNLRRLKQLDGGTEELWAGRLVSLYALHHARLLASQADEWEAVFKNKRRLEEKTESVTRLNRR